MARPTKNNLTSSRRSSNNLDINPASGSKLANFAEPSPLPGVPEHQAGPAVLDRLWTIIESRKNADPGLSHSARLLARGRRRERWSACSLQRFASVKWFPCRLVA
jgi:phosphoribosyl-ATP pyrophosphohydrolase